MSGKITFRYYEDGDYQKMKDLLIECDLYFESTETREHLKEKISRDPRSIIIAEKSGMLIGTVSIVEDGRMPFIFRLGVSKKYRKNGLGSDLLKKAELELKEKGYGESFMFVDAKNKELQLYYQNRDYSKGHLYRFMYKKI